MTILKEMIINQKNGTQIRKIIKSKYNNVNMNIKVIFKFMNYIRKVIASYLKHIYQAESISTLNGNQSYSIDESHVNKIDDTNYWVVGIIINSNLELIRLNLTTARNTDYTIYYSLYKMWKYNC